MAKKQIDWITAKQIYFMSSTVTYQDVANQLKVSMYTIRNRANRERWNEAREKKLSKVEERVLEEQGESIVNIKVRQSKLLKVFLAKVLTKINKADFSSLTERELLEKALDILKSERELYPKQLEVRGKTGAVISLEDVPKEVIDAFIESFEQRIRGNSTPRITNSPKA